MKEINADTRIETNTAGDPVIAFQINLDDGRAIRFPAHTASGQVRNLLNLVRSTLGMIGLPYGLSDVTDLSLEKPSAFIFDNSKAPRAAVEFFVTSGGKRIGGEIAPVYHYNV